MKPAVENWEACFNVACLPLPVLSYSKYSGRSEESKDRRHLSFTRKGNDLDMGQRFCYDECRENSVVFSGAMCPEGC